jgi:hypothetical protein
VNGSSRRRERRASVGRKTGPAALSDGRRNALRNQIEASDDLIDDGLVAEACDQLLDALRRADGAPKPPDFVTGDAATELTLLLELIRESLGGD